VPGSEHSDSTFKAFQAMPIPTGFAAAKRSLDLLVASLAIAFVAPLLAVIAIAIALDSRGPLLFRQTRVGKGGRLFEILKFRTMHVLENGPSIVQAVAGDARVTRVGRVLRVLSLDELPQLFNVVRGDMTLVGPRPHALAHDDYYSARIENYALRHQAKPGVTGWAQVNGLRGPTPDLSMMQDRVAHDIWYIRNASFRLDLKILLRTPREVLSRRNAH
jgi:putative colanic acid biosynthesis UDP-glucose lipid carrier transferase